MANRLVLDIWQLILEHCHFKDQVHLLTCCKFFSDRLRITNLYFVDKNILDLLNDQILTQEKYKHLTKLNAFDNSKITNVSHMKSLRVLNASGYCGLNQDSIKCLDLVEFNTY